MKQQDVRLSIDVPADYHRALKAHAAKNGMSIKDCVLKSMTMPADKIMPEECKQVDRMTFKNALDKILGKYDTLARNLANR